MLTPRLRSSLLSFLFSLGLVFPCATPTWAQATFKAQLRGVVRDPSSAVVPKAKVTITDEATGVPSSTNTDAEGRYIFSNLAPASYEIKVEADGFKTTHQSHIVLGVAQQSELDLKLDVGQAIATVEVTATPVLLNSTSAELGTEVTNRYVTEVPLLDRDISKLSYLSPGVTESQGYAADQTNENFVSNGQRNSSAEIRFDGGLTSTPEAGEGAMFWAHYKPTIEIVQEFKVQTNSFSAEYGSNGGTVINIVSKSGGNQFHGSGYWFGRRSQTDARNFFSRKGDVVPDFTKDIFGGSIGGPLVKQKLFFFFNYDRTRQQLPQTITTTVPTDLQKQGDFSQTFNSDGTLQVIYNPFDTFTDSNNLVHRNPFPGNKIPTGMQSQVALNLMQFYPEPTDAGDPFTGFNNYTFNIANDTPTHQYNAKVDWVITPRSTMSARYSKGYLRRVAPSVFLGGIGQADERNDYNNFVVQFDHTFSSNTLLTLRAGVDRHYQLRDAPHEVDPTTVGFPSILVEANGSVTFPRIDVTDYQGLGLTGWTKTIEAQTNFLWDAAVSKVVGAHSLKAGAEQRTLLSNFFQPAFPGGQFGFDGSQTRENLSSNDTMQGNALASLLVDFGSGGFLSIHPAVAEKSRETAFFVKDDWQVTPNLTLNLGLRYEWSVPYTERFNRIQFAEFGADTGVNIDLSSGDPALQALGLGPTDLKGVGAFATSHRRNISPDRNNIAPRLGVAYRLNNKTVLRAGGGIYYGINPATSFQDVGAAFRKNVNWTTTLDNYATRFATLENPFPTGNITPQGTKYGILNQWGFDSSSNQSGNFRNAEIYQWSFSVQRELPGNSVFEAAYSANRSTHLAFGGTKSRNFIPSALRAQISADQHANWPGGAADCDVQSCVTNYLNNTVANPFYNMFNGGSAVFNEPDSRYALSNQIPLINLLRPYPQFDGGFEGFTLFTANATYNSMQLKYEKRYSHGLNLIGSYTLAKETDDSSYGSNGWLGNSTNVQDLGNLAGEHSIGASDVRHRAVLGGSYELPIGHGKLVGSNWGPIANVLLGGWQVNGFLQFQSGLPVNMGLSGGNLADGSQRANVTGNPRSHFSMHDVVFGKGPYFNASAYSNPGDQIPGNAPRFDTRVRGDGIRNLDLSFIKNVQIRENMKLQLRTEFFNFTNTPRFGDPNGSVGDGNFGVINSQVNSPRQVQFGARFLF
jgi:hypothetical protein